MTDSIAVCVYDNPATMARECWQNGKLVASYSVSLMWGKGQWPPPARCFHMGANVGPWKTGQLIGSASAMKE